MKKHKIEIYTDGSCIGNPGPGGWAALIMSEDLKAQIAGGEADTTNNRMEMTAIIEALKFLHQKLSKEELNSAEIILHSDSNLLIQSLNLGWKRKANLDLWAEIDKLRARLKIKWIWVKAHANNKHNNSVDKLAFNQAQKFISS